MAIFNRGDLDFIFKQVANYGSFKGEYTVTRRNKIQHRGRLHRELNCSTA